MEMEEDLEDCLIPRFSIQPAVENALFHGILPKGTGKIEVKVYKSGAGIRIQIRDDGIGIEKEQMEEINERLKMAVFSEEGNQEISRLKMLLTTILAEHSGMSAEQLEPLLDRDTFLSPHEARDLGLIDSIIIKRGNYVRGNEH